MTSEQLDAARAERMRQNGHGAITIEDVRTWIEETGLCIFLPRSAQAGFTTPTFVEAVAGQRTTEPTLELIATAESLLVRLEAEGVAVRLNLAGQPGDQPDYVVAGWVLPYIYALRGDRDWRRSPQLTGSRQVSPLAIQAAKQIDSAHMTATQVRDALGREVTEAAVLRALHELWKQLRIIPVVSEVGQPALWQPLRERFQKAIAEGASTSQVTAISVLASIYLQAVIAASMEDIELFLSPLTSRSKIREVVRGLAATRQVHSTTMGHSPMYYVAGTLPEFSIPMATQVGSFPAYRGSSYSGSDPDQSHDEDMYSRAGNGVARSIAQPARQASPVVSLEDVMKEITAEEQAPKPATVISHRVPMHALEPARAPERATDRTPEMEHSARPSISASPSAKNLPTAKASQPRPRPAPTAAPRDRSRSASGSGDSRIGNRTPGRSGSSSVRRPAPASRSAASNGNGAARNGSRNGSSIGSNNVSSNGSQAGKSSSATNHSSKNPARNGVTSHPKNGNGNGYGNHRSAKVESRGNGNKNHAGNGHAKNGHAAGSNHGKVAAKKIEASARPAKFSNARGAASPRPGAGSNGRPKTGMKSLKPVIGSTARNSAGPAGRAGSATRVGSSRSAVSKAPASRPAPRSASAKAPVTSRPASRPAAGSRNGSKRTEREPAKASAAKRYGFAGQAKQAPKPASKRTASPASSKSAPKFAGKRVGKAVAAASGSKRRG